MAIEKIISGGQTGVDRAALDAGRAASVPIGGWCPRGRRAEDGAIPDEYPLSETPSEDYAQRTAWNVRDSDGTLIIAPSDLEGGTARTREEAQRRGQPWLHVDAPDADSISAIREWIVDEGIRILNVAGPRASEVEGIYETALRILDHLLGDDVAENS